MDPAAFADDLSHPFELAAKLEVFHPERSPLGGAAHQVQDLFVLEGFGNVVEGAHTHGLDGRFNRRVGGDDHHRQVLIEGLDFGENLEPRAIGKHQIEKDDVDLLVTQNAHALCGCGRLVIVETTALQEGPEHILKDGLVIDYED